MRFARYFKMSTDTRKRQFLRGMKAGVPVILGFVPVGIAYAIMARRAGFSVAETCYMSASVFAGASQMMVVERFTQGAGIFAMIAATFILNLRHVIMGICVGNKMKPASLLARLLAGFGVTDEGFAIFTTEKEENSTVSFYLGLTLVTYLSWVVGTFLGAVMSGFLPELVSASLGVSLYAMFIGLLVPNLRGNFRLFLLVVFAAVCNTILSKVMDPSTALVVSTLLGAFIGVFFVRFEGEENEH